MARWHLPPGADGWFRGPSMALEGASPLQFQLVCARNAERKHEKVKRPWNFSYFGHLMWFPLMQVSAWKAGCV